MDERNLGPTAYEAGRCRVAVVGAGHAGIEAALACARLGLSTLCFTINLDAVGNMPCNPAIGGTGKGHLVRELDALGGEMGRAADRACIQYRLLNRGKGPAVWSLRAQADRREYQKVMKHTLERQENLWVKQAEVMELRDRERARCPPWSTHTGAVYRRAGRRCLPPAPIWGAAPSWATCIQDSGPGRHGTPPLPLTEQPAGRWACPCAGSRPARPPGSTPAAWTSPRWSCSPGTRTAVPFSFQTETPPENRAVC